MLSKSSPFIIIEKLSLILVHYDNAISHKAVYIFLYFVKTRGFGSVQSSALDKNSDFELWVDSNF